jgi:hypothetical protein
MNVVERVAAVARQDFPSMLSLFADGDEPRTRRTDPATSHMAGDKSQATIHESRAAVLALVRQEGMLTGSEANELYRLRWERNGWPQIAWDSPRKRMGDLHRDGLLLIVNDGAPRGTEREYREAL